MNQRTVTLAPTAVVQEFDECLFFNICQSDGDLKIHNKYTVALEGGWGEWLTIGCAFLAQLDTCIWVRQFL